MIFENTIVRLLTLCCTNKDIQVVSDDEGPIYTKKYVENAVFSYNILDNNNYKKIIQQLEKFGDPNQTQRSELDKSFN